MTEKKRFKPAPPPPPANVRKKYLNKQGRIVLNSLGVEVTISDIRNRYGNVDVLVTPVAGKGTVWVRADRVKALK